ncbi:SCP2 sterol-binding domain-containing protein [bacterium]|nr:SCP2 sterol-binding domain-containing protein [bacterium]
MAVFESGEKCGEVLGGFFDLMADTPKIADKLIASDLIVQFNYTDPDCTLTMNCSGDTMEVLRGEHEFKPIVILSMKADIAHKFWFGKVNLTMALARRQMIAKGPVPKILRLLPAIKPTYKMYPIYLNDNGFEKYNIH